jgi:hypothetical protein
MILVDRTRDKGRLWTGYRTRGTWGQDSEQGILVDKDAGQRTLVDKIQDKGCIQTCGKGKRQGIHTCGQDLGQGIHACGQDIYIFY